MCLAETDGLCAFSSWISWAQWRRKLWNFGEAQGGVYFFGLIFIADLGDLRKWSLLVNLKKWWGSSLTGLILSAAPEFIRIVRNFVLLIFANEYSKPPNSSKWSKRTITKCNHQQQNLFFLFTSQIYRLSFQYPNSKIKSNDQIGLMVKQISTALLWRGITSFQCKLLWKWLKISAKSEKSMNEIV